MSTSIGPSQKGNSTMKVFQNGQFENLGFICCLAPSTSPEEGILGVALFLAWGFQSQTAEGKLRPSNTHL